MEKREEKSERYRCPIGHLIISIPENYARDFSDGSVDSDGEEQFESGLFCMRCRRAYGLSKLVLSNP
jgi:hypothetical protein